MAKRKGYVLRCRIVSDNIWWWHASGCDGWSLAPLWRHPGHNPAFVTLTELIRPELEPGNWGMCDAVTVMKNPPADLCFNDLRTSWKIHKNEFWIRGVAQWGACRCEVYDLVKIWLSFTRGDRFSRNSISNPPLQHHQFQVTLTGIINEDWCRLESVASVNGPLSLTGYCVTVNRSLWSVRGIMAHGGHGAQWSVGDDHNITLHYGNPGRHYLHVLKRPFLAFLIAPKAFFSVYKF